MDRQIQKKQRYVLCPICKKGKIIMENETGDEVPLQLVLPNSKRKACWFVKCEVCKNQIGISTKSPH